MSDSYSDALVFFGATGDLAYKMIFPALQAMRPVEPKRRLRQVSIMSPTTALPVGPLPAPRP